MRSCLPRAPKRLPNLKASNMKTMLRNAMMALMMGLLAMKATAYELPKPTLYALYFTADWCPNCKALTPVLEQARKEGKLDAKDVLFVKLDLTDKTTIHQALLLSSAIGVAPFVQKQGSSTGYVALVAADKTTELARFDRTAKAEDIIAAIEKNLGGTEKK
jgi:thiol-disulfide isomerase/thioredoxin